MLAGAATIPTCLPHFLMILIGADLVLAHAGLACSAEAASTGRTMSLAKAAMTVTGYAGVTGGTMIGRRFRLGGWLPHWRSPAGSFLHRDIHFLQALYNPAIVVLVAQPEAGSLAHIATTGFGLGLSTSNRVVVGVSRHLRIAAQPVGYALLVRMNQPDDHKRRMWKSSPNRCS